MNFLELIEYRLAYADNRLYFTSPTERERERERERDQCGAKQKDAGWRWIFQFEASINAQCEIPYERFYDCIQREYCKLSKLLVK